MAADLMLVQEVAEAATFLAVVAVARPDGTVHASLVKAGLLDDPLDHQPSVGIVVSGNARKLQLLRQAPSATVVFHDAWRWVAVEGPARLVGPDDPPARGDVDVPEVIRSVFRVAGGTHDDWDEFDRVMADERRCAVFVRSLKVRTNG